jgi:hypothetical protein
MSIDVLSPSIKQEENLIKKKKKKKKKKSKDKSSELIIDEQVRMALFFVLFNHFCFGFNRLQKNIIEEI